MKQIPADAGMEGNLAHQNEQWNHDKTIVGKRVVKIDGQEAHGGFWRPHDGEAYETDNGHHKRHRHAGKQHDAKKNTSENADLKRCHGSIMGLPGFNK
jgi:hypothetical protein